MKRLFILIAATVTLAMGCGIERHIVADARYNAKTYKALAEGGAVVEGPKGNFLEKGKFEGAKINNVRKFWKVYSKVPKESMKLLKDPDGNTFLRMTAKKDDEHKPLAQVYIPVDPAWKALRISGRVRGKNIQVGEKRYHIARIMFTYYQGKTKKRHAHLADVRADTDGWREFNLVAPIKNDVDSLRIQFGFYGPAAGTFDIDDISVSVGNVETIDSPKVFATIMAERFPKKEIGAKVDESKIAVVYHVDTRAENASDANDGTKDAPFKTIGAAVTKANETGKPAKVLIHEGVYREDQTKVMGNTKLTDPTLVVEGEKKGKVIISGAEVYTDWKKDGAYYTHSWKYAWGTPRQPFAKKPGGKGYIEPLGLRRECIFINTNIILRQYETRDDVREGGFYVDEDKKELVMIPPKGIDPATAYIEVGERDTMLYFDLRANFVIRNLYFRHFAQEVRHGAITVVNSSNIVIEDSEFNINNGTGIKVAKVMSFTYNRITANSNGYNGIGVNNSFYIYSEDCETSYNNWRSHLGKLYYWDVAGNKNFWTRYYTIKRRKSVGNMSHGIWFDGLHEHVTMSDSVFVDNECSGIYNEANEGPLTFENCKMVNNRYAMLYAESWFTTVKNCLMLDNRHTQVAVRVRYRNWDEPGSGTIWTFNAGALTMEENVIATYLDNGRIMNRYGGGTGGKEGYARHMKNYEGKKNTYFSTIDTPFMDSEGKELSFDDWKKTTRQDRNSKLQDPNVQRLRLSMDDDSRLTYVYAEGESATFSVKMQNEKDATTSVTFYLCDAREVNDSLHTTPVYYGMKTVGVATSAPYTVTWESAEPGQYVLFARADTKSGMVYGSDRKMVVVNPPIEPGEKGRIKIEYWENVPGLYIKDFMESEKAQTEPEVVTYLPEVEFIYRLDDAYAKLSGYLHPPETGEYTFRISGDDESILYLSDGEGKENLKKMCYIIRYTPYRQWEQFREEAYFKSESVTLEAGRAYYFEVLFKEGGGGAHVTLGWDKPDGTFEGPIPSAYISYPKE